jgi:putative NADH-flavin reductase
MPNAAKLMNLENLFASHAAGLAPCSGRDAFTVLLGGKIMIDQSGKSSHAVADYISAMTAQMAQMAASEQYTTLAHLLEMAWLEAEQLCGRDSVAPPHRSANG